MNGINVNDYGYIIRTDLKDLTSITERYLIDYVKKYLWPLPNYIYYQWKLSLNFVLSSL